MLSPVFREEIYFFIHVGVQRLLGVELRREVLSRFREVHGDNIRVRVEDRLRVSGQPGKGIGLRVLSALLILNLEVEFRKTQTPTRKTARWFGDG